MNHAKQTLGNEVNAVDAYICDGVRTPIGKFGGALSSVRTDDLAAAKSSVLTDESAPPNFPIGVRTPSHIYASTAFTSFPNVCLA